jgi:hypothetical protein
VDGGNRVRVHVVVDVALEINAILRLGDDVTGDGGVLHSHSGCGGLKLDTVAAGVKNRVRRYRHGRYDARLQVDSIAAAADDRVPGDGACRRRVKHASTFSTAMASASRTTSPRPMGSGFGACP